MSRRPTPSQRARERAARQIARDAARREEHVRLVVERDGNPDFVHRAVGPDAVTYSWAPDSELGEEITAGFEDARREFREKFGREMTDDDPVFFDPDADTPTPVDPKKMYAAMREAAVKAGVDTAFIDAAADVGYLVTETNQHTFSYEEIRAYEAAVARHRAAGDDD